MYLIDTSVWIDYLRKKSNKAVDVFSKILTKNFPFGITHIIYQEILQGAASQKDFTTLQKYLSTQTFYAPKDDMKTHESAARLYFDARKKGFTIRSTIDCLIAQIAIEHKLVLLHNDKDFLIIKKIAPSLKLN